MNKPEFPHEHAKGLNLFKAEDQEIFSLRMHDAYSTRKHFDTVREYMALTGGPWTGRDGALRLMIKHWINEWQRDAPT
jgi:hypothetical protein